MTGSKTALNFFILLGIFKMYKISCELEPVTERKWISVEEFQSFKQSQAPAGLERGITSSKLSKTFIARSNFGGNSIAGSFSAWGNTSSFAYNGTENTDQTLDEIEVFIYPSGSISWVPFDGETIPTDTIETGDCPEFNEICYPCRTLWKKELLLGNFVATIGGFCTFPYNGTESKSASFEFPVVSEFGKNVKHLKVNKTEEVTGDKVVLNGTRILPPFIEWQLKQHRLKILSKVRTENEEELNQTRID